MKKLFLVILLCISFGVAHSQIKIMIETEKNEREKIDAFMSSGYSNIVVTRIDTDESDGSQDSSKAMSIVVDKDNNTYTEINYSPQFSKTVIKLDNNIISREIFNDKDQIAGKTLYFYNDIGRLAKRELYFGDLKAFDEIYEYNGRKLTKMKYVMTDGTLVSYSLFVFDKSDNLLKETKYNSEDQVDYVYEYSYGKKSRLTEEKITFGSDNVTITTYSYGSDGNLKEKLTTAKGKQTSFIKYSYKDNNLTEEIYDTPEMKTTKTYTYNNGLLSRIKVTDQVEKSTYELVYEYVK